MSGVDGGPSKAVQRLAEEFWSWRSAQQPRSRDDILRLERPAGWLPDWGPEAVSGYYKQLSAFEDAHRSINVAAAPVEIVVDHALLGSALARVRFELDVLRNWRRQPSFYVDQSVGVVFDLLRGRRRARGRNCQALIAASHLPCKPCPWGGVRSDYPGDRPYERLAFQLKRPRDEFAVRVGAERS